LGFGVWVWKLGFWVLGFGLWGLGFGVWVGALNLGFDVWGLGFYAFAATLEDVKAAVAAGADLNLRFEVWGLRFVTKLQPNLYVTRLPDEEQRTLAHKAAMRGHVTLLYALAEAAANLSVVDRHGTNCLRCT